MYENWLKDICLCLPKDMADAIWKSWSESTDQTLVFEEVRSGLKVRMQGGLTQDMFHDFVLYPMISSWLLQKEGIGQARVDRFWALFTPPHNPLRDLILHGPPKDELGRIFPFKLTRTLRQELPKKIEILGSRSWPQPYAPSKLPEIPIVSSLSVDEKET